MACAKCSQTINKWFASCLLFLFQDADADKKVAREIAEVLREGPEVHPFLATIRDLLDRRAVEALRTERPIPFEITEEYICDAAEGVGMPPAFTEDSLAFIIACINGYAHERGWHFLIDSLGVGKFVPWDGEAPHEDFVDTKVAEEDEPGRVVGAGGAHMIKAAHRPKRVQRKEARQQASSSKSSRPVSRVEMQDRPRPAASPDQRSPAGFLDLTNPQLATPKPISLGQISLTTAVQEKDKQAPKPMSPVRTETRNMLSPGAVPLPAGVASRIGETPSTIPSPKPDSLAAMSTPLSPQTAQAQLSEKKASARAERRREREEKERQAISLDVPSSTPEPGSTPVGTLTRNTGKATAQNKSATPVKMEDTIVSADDALAAIAAAAQAHAQSKEKLKRTTTAQLQSNFERKARNINNYNADDG